MTTPTPTPAPTPTPTSTSIQTLNNVLRSENGSFYFKRKAETFTLAGLQASGSGDPHMILRVKNGAVLARWDDNAPGSNGKEVLFFYIKTPTDEISVFYTNSGWNGDTGPYVIGGNRYIHNGTEVVNFTGTVNVGPVQLKTSLYDMNLSFDTISNVEKFGGGVFIALEASIAAGGYVDGGWGSNVDGYGNLGQNIGYSRSDIVVGEGVLIQNGQIVSTVVKDTAEQQNRQFLKAIKDNFIGFNAQANNLPLDPVALQLADMNAPGGDFDGIVNPPENQNGMIDAQGNVGPGLGLLMPEEMQYTGNYYAEPTYAGFIQKDRLDLYNELF